MTEPKLLEPEPAPVYLSEDLVKPTRHSREDVFDESTELMLGL